MTKQIIDCQTGETVERELNKSEKDQQKIDEAQIAKDKALLKSEQDAQLATKQAILARIGLTADELKTILG
jgi:hypothetical protein